MAICPFATVMLLPESKTQPRLTPTQVIAHSMGNVATAEDLFRYWSGTDDGGLESHFCIAEDGELFQFMDTDVIAQANASANTRAISWESENLHGSPDTHGWSDAAVATAVRLHLWLADVHDIPRRVCPAHDKPGFGYHSMWGAPSPWTPAVGKTCPGAARIPQWKTRIMPATITGTIPEDDMPLTPADIDAIAQRTRQVIATAQLPYGLDALRRRLEGLAAGQAALAEAVAQLGAGTGGGAVIDYDRVKAAASAAVREAFTDAGTED